MIKIKLIPTVKKENLTSNIPKPSLLRDNDVVEEKLPMVDKSLDEVWDDVELSESPYKDVRQFQPIVSDLANILTEKLILPNSSLSAYRKDCGNAIYHGIMQSAGFTKAGKKYSGTCQLDTEQQKITLRYVSDYAEKHIIDVDLPDDIVKSIIAYYCKKEWDTKRQNLFAELFGTILPSKNKVESSPNENTNPNPSTINNAKDDAVSSKSNLDPNHIEIEIQLSKFDADTVYVKFVDRNGRLVEIPIYIQDVGDINIEDDLGIDEVLHKFALFFDGTVTIVPVNEKNIGCEYNICRGDSVIHTATVVAFDGGDPVELSAELLLILYHILDRYSRMQKSMYLWESPIDNNGETENIDVDDEEMLAAATSFATATATHSTDDSDEENTVEGDIIESEDESSNYDEDEDEMFVPIRRSAHA